MIVTFLTKPGLGAQSLHGLLFCLKTLLSINCLKSLVELIVTFFFLFNKGTHNWDAHARYTIANFDFSTLFSDKRYFC